MKTINKTLIVSALSWGLLTTPAIAKAVSNIDSSHWINKLTVSGALEVEYGSSESYAGVDSSDVTLATVELGFDARINDRIDAHLTFLYEEDDTPIEVDEGTISVSLNAGHSVVMGQMYVPFGAF